MKKAILNMLMLFAVTGVATAQTVTVADVEALPGETVKATLELTDPTETYTGFQLSIQFPETGFSNVANGDGTNWAGLIEVGAMNSGKVKFSSASSKAFKSGTIDVEFTVSNSLPLNNYEVTVTDIQFEKSGTEYHIDDVTFNVNVVERHTVILDEMATTAPSAIDGVNVKVKRTIKANEWSTICLPFAMTEAQVKAAFGNDVVLKDFNGYTTTKDGEDNIVGIEVNFNTVNPVAIKANHPYVIKVSSAISEFTVNEVDIDPEDEPTVAAIKRTKKQWSELIGTYVANTTVGENCLFLSGNKFWYSNGNTKMKGFRAYFDFYDVLSEVENASTRIGFNFDETTGIKEIHGSNKSVEGTYDLQGRKVEEPTNKGLYIVNGHKVVIK